MHETRVTLYGPKMRNTSPTQVEYKHAIYTINFNMQLSAFNHSARG